jgi:hypothetical protein
MHRKLRIVAWISLLFASGCAGNERAIQNPNPTAIMEDFRSGKIVLTCGIQCAGTWFNDRSRIAILVSQGRWEDVVVGITSIGYGQDLAYYWLGMAAEALGRPDRAVTYYRIAQVVRRDRSTLPCKESGRGGCFGIDISGATEAKVRYLEQYLANLSTLLAQQRERAARAQAAALPTQAAAPAAAAAPPRTATPQAAPVSLPSPPVRSPLDAEWDRLRVIQ